MKKNYNILAFVILIFFLACTKNDGPIPKSIQLDRVPAPLITKETGSSVSIDVSNLSSFNAKFNVALYFPNDAPPEKFDIVVRKNDNNNNVKLYQSGINQFPSHFTISAAQIETLFGNAIVLGDKYDIGADVYTSAGKKFEAFPLLGKGYADGFQPDHPGFSASVSYVAACLYNPDLYQGDFVVVTDEFLDTTPGDIIPLTKIDNTHFSFIYPSGINPLPIIVTVNPLTNQTSITKQRFGSAFTWEPSYTNPNMETSTSVDRNWVKPCDKTLSLDLQFSVDQGAFSGSFLFQLRKK